MVIPMEVWSPALPHNRLANTAHYHFDQTWVDSFLNRCYGMKPQRVYQRPLQTLSLLPGHTGVTKSGESIRAVYEHLSSVDSLSQTSRMLIFEEYSSLMNTLNQAHQSGKKQRR